MIEMLRDGAVATAFGDRSASVFLEIAGAIVGIKGAIVLRQRGESKI